VVDLRRDLGVAGDGEHLVDRLVQAVALAAHVGDVHAAVLSGRSAERHQLGRLGVEGGGVDERGADAERALAHRLVHERHHAGELVGGRLTIGVAELVDAHRRRADEGGDVG